MCEEATEVETHHQQTAATTMGVAEDDTPSSLSSHPNLNTNNPSQEGKNEEENETLRNGRAMPASQPVSSPKHQPKSKQTRV